jgi:hypothetical protein
LSFGSWNQKVDPDAFIAPSPKVNGRSTLIAVNYPCFYAAWEIREEQGWSR